MPSSLGSGCHIPTSTWQAASYSFVSLRNFWYAIYFRRAIFFASVMQLVFVYLPWAVLVAFRWCGSKISLLSWCWLLSWTWEWWGAYTCARSPPLSLSLTQSQSCQYWPSSGVTTHHIFEVCLSLSRNPHTTWQFIDDTLCDIDIPHQMFYSMI